MRIRHFIRHYLEMLVAMFLGMELLGIPAKMVVDTSGRTTVMLAEMGITMTLPMVAWMAVRGHGWRPNAEMAASMLVPTAAAIALFELGIVTDSGTLLLLEHAVMLPAMLVAMLLRRDEYTGHHRRHVEPGRRVSLLPPHVRSRPSTRFRSTAFVATTIELTDIRSADHSGRSSIPAEGNSAPAATGMASRL
jgi:hypothetical protein